jgi:hypothetical protein
MGACWSCQVVSFAGELLSNAEGLLREGLTTVEIADGYSKAAKKARGPWSSPLRGNHKPAGQTAKVLGE